MLELSKDLSYEHLSFMFLSDFWIQTSAFSIKLISLKGKQIEYTKTVLSCGITVSQKVILRNNDGQKSCVGQDF